MATTSSGAPDGTASYGAPPRRRQHRLGHLCGRRQHRVGAPLRTTTTSLEHLCGRRQHRVGHGRLAESGVAQCARRHADAAERSECVRPAEGQDAPEAARCAATSSLPPPPPPLPTDPPLLIRHPRPVQAGVSSHGKDAAQSQLEDQFRPAVDVPSSARTGSRAFRHSAGVVWCCANAFVGRAGALRAPDQRRWRASFRRRRARSKGFERFIAWTAPAAPRGRLCLLRRHAEGQRHRDRPVSGSRARQRTRQRRVGIRDRVEMLGHRRVRGIGEARREIAFDTIGIHRLEARAAIATVAGTARSKARRRQEGTLRQSFLKNGEYLDQALWAILAEDWRGTGATTVWEEPYSLILLFPPRYIRFAS